MRTTLNIDDDVLSAAKEIADFQQRTVGQVISSLVRRALLSAPLTGEIRNGIRLLPIQPGANPITLEMINKLRDELL